MISRVLLETVVTADLDAAVGAFQRDIGWEVAAAADVDAELAGFWRLDGDAYRRWALVASPESTRGWLRFVEGPEDDRLGSFHHPGLFNAELLCRDVDELHARLESSSSFEVLCDPVTYDLGSTGGAVSRSFATRGPGGAGIFFTTYLSVPPPRKLPVCKPLVGPMFNSAVATEGDSDAAGFYEEVLGMARRLEGRIASPGINRILDLPADWGFHMVVYKGEGAGLIEVDLHENPLPRGFGARRGWLKPGNSFLTLETSDLAGILSRAGDREVSWSGETTLSMPPYSGRLAAMLVGPAGELVEVLESDPAEQTKEV